MIGTKIGHYDVTGHLGSGGMGDVYQATDAKLGRSVAIKLLPEAFARDNERIARFGREARVLASLNHPNIAALYGLEESAGQNFLVMEFVAGETLAARIARGPIPVDEALGIAKQIAEALEAAHEKNVVHRDLKPANVKITPEGKVKVLDFGLAKAVEPEPDNANLSNSPTLSMAATNAGVILGTAAYMSPEQAKGRRVDRRTDIFAFGCVLYEMLTGRRAFEGDDVPEILGAVLKSEPDWSGLPAGTSVSIQRLLRRSLKKDPRQRLADIRDARIEMDEAGTEAGSIAPAPARGARLAWITSLGVAAVLIIAMAIPTVRHLRETSPPEMRLEINTPSTPAPLEFALSPDGRYIVFVASGNGPQRLWLRALDKTDAQPMAGTDGADYPFWSGDSRSIGFTAEGKLKRIDIAGGPPQVLANSSALRGGAWNGNGTILFTEANLGRLSRIAASGGEPVPVTRLDPPRQTEHRNPQFLPDGRHFLFYAIGTPEASGLYLGSLDGGEPKRLGAADSAGAYLAPGMIAFVRGTTLVAQHLDLKRGDLTGDPVRLADPVGSTAIAFGGFSVSADGGLAYRDGGGALRQLKWYDRTGKAVGVAGEPDSTNLLYPELSPDGGHVTLQRTVQNNFDVWLMDLVRGGMTRFTFDPAIDCCPLWSLDGMRIAFLSTRKGSGNLYLKLSSGAGAEELLLETPNYKYPQDWSKDGRFLLYAEDDPKTGRDLWALPMREAQGREAAAVNNANDRKPVVVVKTPFEERNGQFSPDGRWVAYETNESGRFEIVVQPFPMPSGKWQVSTTGGIQPRWKADGKELYFIAPDGKLMAASISATGAIFAAATPVALFPAPVVTGVGANKQEYVVSRDGRFLINQPVEASTTTPITLILNWNPEQKK